ncbi:PspC domain-containing protein [Leucobacter sp. cx-328]|uniref:PspC domain-containing protein n=1 Tax=unclassified Leucobacter TaxID=2621730 RepID=UPI00165E95B0|nr:MULTISPECIES: PspC domain-containing protein [unclassified Leucobacter]MBC9944800.1 PspC domain-containing protein [Leucobacter sp. cx-328]
MNTTPEPTQNGNAPFGTPFFTWLRGLGITRGSDRWFAGVAGGLAAKAGIDPLIVRGIFIVLAVLGGPGLLLYLAGWLLLPDTSGRIHLEELFRGRASAGVVTAAVIIAVVVVIPAIFGIIAPGVSSPLSVWNWGWGWGTWMLPHWLQVLFTIGLWLAIVGGAVWWVSRVALKRGRKQNAAGASDPTAAPATDPAAAAAATPATAGAAPSTASFAGPAESATTAGGSAPTSDASDSSAGTPDPTWEQRLNGWEKNVSDWGDRTSEKASKWGDDVGRKADEWSAQYAAHHDARKLGAGHVIITLALALLAAGSCAIWALTFDARLPFASGVPASLIAGITGALVVLAVSLIVAGIRGRSTGVVGFLSTVGVIALLVTAVFPWGSRFQPFGNMYVPAGQAPGAVVVAGDMDLDLTNLQPNDGDLTAWLGAGRVNVSLPIETPAVITLRVLAGNIEEPGAAGARTAGPLLSRTIEVNGADHSGHGSGSVAHRSADLPHITVYVLAGNIRVFHQMESTDSSSTSGSKTDDTGKSQAELAEEQAAAEAEAEAEAKAARIGEQLDHVQWQLTEPGLSAKDRTELEARETELESQLARAKQEVIR